VIARALTENDLKYKALYASGKFQVCCTRIFWTCYNMFSCSKNDIYLTKMGVSKLFVINEK